MKYVVAQVWGGLMESPDRAVKYPRVVEASTEKEAIALYNTATKATYYKGGSHVCGYGKSK